MVPIDGPNLTLHVLVLAALLLFSAFFSGSETALFSLTYPTLRQWEERGRRWQRLAASLMASHHTTLIAILLGNTFVNILAAMVLNRVLGQWIQGGAGPVISAVVVTAILLIAGEVTPKTIALARARELAPVAAPVIAGCRWGLWPVIVLLEWGTGRVLRWSAPKRPTAISVEEFQTFVGLGRTIGTFDEHEAELIDDVFRLRETTASAVMVPRVDVRTVDPTWGVEELMEQVQAHRHRRLPVVTDGELDQLVGVLDVRRLMRASSRQRRRWAHFCVSRPLYVPAAAPLNRVLATLRAEQQGIAFVVDEYGGISGILSVEDIIEEVVGEVADEYDPPSWAITRVGEHRWRVSGGVPLKELAESVGLEFPDASADTVGGAIAEMLGEMPRAGQVAESGAWRLVVREVDRRRVLTVDLRRIVEVGR